MIPTTFMTILPSLPLPLLPLTAPSPSVPLPPASPKTKKNEAATNAVPSLTSAGTYYNPNTTTLNPIPSPPEPPTPPTLSSLAAAPIVIPLLLLSGEMAPVAPSHCAMRVGLDSRRRREERVRPPPRRHRRLPVALWNRRRCTITRGTHTSRVRRCSASRRGWGTSSVSWMTPIETPPITAFRSSRGDSTSRTERAWFTTSRDERTLKKKHNDNNNDTRLQKELPRRSRPTSKHTGSYTSTFYDDVFDCDGYVMMVSSILCFFFSLFSFSILFASFSSLSLLHKMVREWDKFYNLSLLFLWTYFFNFLFQLHI